MVGMQGPAIIWRPATPEYVLAVLVDSHCQQCHYDPEADPSAVLSFKTSVAEWRWACDLVGWRRLARALDKRWALGYSERQWREVLRPAGQRTLRDVCHFIAQRAWMPEVQPARVLGNACLRAGAFLAVLDTLRRAGVDVSKIRPSTPLVKYTTQAPEAFLSGIGRLAPNALPPINGDGVGQWDLSMLFIGVLRLLANRPLRPRPIYFGQLETFGDLAKAVARQSGAYCGGTKVARR